MSPAPREVSAAAQQPCTTVPSFFSLPRELRDMIYPLVIGEQGQYCQSRKCHIRELDLDFDAHLEREDLWPTCKRFSIARTCRTANEEANGFIYKNNTFCFRVMTKKWLRPRISQRNADDMQKIHITVGPDKTSRVASAQLLRMFTVPRVVRQECRIIFDLDSGEEIEFMRPIFQVMAGLTGFQVVTVKMSEANFLYSIYHEEAIRVWKQMGRDLEPALGPPVPEHQECHYLEFEPRDYTLWQKGLLQ